MAMTDTEICSNYESREDSAFCKNCGNTMMEHQKPMEPRDRIVPASMQIGGVLRTGVLYEDDDQKLFLFIAQEVGALCCWRAKFGENSMRATAECFKIPHGVLVQLGLMPVIVMAGQSKLEKVVGGP